MGLCAVCIVRHHFQGMTNLLRVPWLKSVPKTPKQMLSRHRNHPAASATTIYPPLPAMAAPNQTYTSDRMHAHTLCAHPMNTRQHRQVLHSLRHDQESFSYFTEADGGYDVYKSTIECSRSATGVFGTSRGPCTVVLSLVDCVPVAVRCILSAHSELQ